MAKFYRYLNTFPMPLWLAMMFAPNHPLTERASRSSAVFIIAALHYVAALILGIGRGRQEEKSVSLDFSSLEAVRSGLSTSEGALATWAHMLALDLFTGAWIYRQSRRLNAPAWVRIPALLFTLAAGPFGLLIFLLWRTFGAKKGEALPGVEM